MGCGMGGAAVAGRADGRRFELVLGGKVGAALRPVPDRLCTRTRVRERTQKRWPGVWGEESGEVPGHGEGASEAKQKVRIRPLYFFSKVPQRENVSCSGRT